MYIYVFAYTHYTLTLCSPHHDLFYDLVRIIIRSIFSTFKNCSRISLITEKLEAKVSQASICSKIHPKDNYAV